MPQSQGTRFTAEPLTFVVRHQLWDANVEDHTDQGVSIDVTAEIVGKPTVVLRFNCFDLERSYVYGPENPELATPGRVGGGQGVHCRLPRPVCLLQVHGLRRLRGCQRCHGSSVVRADATRQPASGRDPARSGGFTR